MASNKFAEKLMILNNHAVGLLTRLYRINQLMKSADRPGFLSEKSFEATVKQGIKRFPTIDLAKEQGSPMYVRREVIVSALEEPYMTFVDVMAFKDAVNEVLTALGAERFVFDLRANYEMTAQFFDLLSNYMSVLIMLSRVEDRKVIATLYSLGYEVSKGVSEAAFPRLGQMIADYDSPLKKFPEDFAPHCNMIVNALNSLNDTFSRRYVNAAQMRKENFFNILANPMKMTTPVAGMTLSQDGNPIMCDIIPLEKMVRWITFGYLGVPTQLCEDVPADLLCKALGDGYALPLYRDELICMHTSYETMFSVIKEAKKFNKTKVTEQAAVGVGTAPTFHEERRNYLRQILHQLLNILSDKPGLLGPKAPMVLSAMSLARDEILWLFRHQVAQTPKTKVKVNPEQLKDPQLPALVYALAELQHLFAQHSNVIAKYHAEFLADYDLTTLRNVSQGMSYTGPEENMFRSFFSTLEALGPENEKLPDLKGLRMDWNRLQAAMACGSSPFPLMENLQFVELMNLVSLHSILVDDVRQIVSTFSDVSDLWFFKKAFLESSAIALQNPTQQRYAAGFAMLCDNFPNASTEFVPEERAEIGRDSQNMANHIFLQLAEAANKAINTMAMQHVQLGQNLLPSKALGAIINKAAKTPKGQKRADKRAIPGVETRSKEVTNRLRSAQQTLSDLCWAINHHSTVIVHNLAFSPREYLTELLEKSLGQTLVHLIRTKDEHKVARPSSAVLKIKSFMASLRSIENYISVDVSSIFSAAFLDQSLVVDSNKPSVATMYVEFFAEMIRSNRSTPNLYVSRSRQAFVSRSGNAFKCEEYTDITEMRALCSLIGPFGARQLDDILMRELSGAMADMKKLVIGNREHLEVLKTQTGNPQFCSEALKRMNNIDQFTNLCIYSGIILSFRELLANACATTMETRIPFIYNAIKDLHTHTNARGVDLLASSAGIRSDVDPHLAGMLHEHATAAETDLHVYTLMTVMFSVTLRHLAGQSATTFNPALEAHENNAHVLALTFNELTACLFTLVAPRPEEARLYILQAQSELLRIASILLLRVADMSDRDVPKHRDHVYVIIEKFVEKSPYVTADVLESFFPYGLIRSAYHELYKKKMSRRGVPKVDENF